MNSDTENPSPTPASARPPARKVVGKPFVKGICPNPGGRPKREPRVKRFARRFSRRMIKVLVDLAEDSKNAPSERRKAAMDVIAYDAGRPAVVQEIAGRDGQPVGPLVNIQLGQQPGSALTAAQAYAYMVSGAIPADPDHEAFRTIESKPEEAPSDEK